MLLASSPGPSPEQFSTREVVLATALILAIKACWFVADHTLRVYMGDSMVYLQTAAWLSGSPGRSYLYGALLHFTAYPLHSPWAIIALHSLCSVASALALWFFLRTALRVRPVVALSAAALFALEPAQVFFERMVMAETMGLLALVATLLAYSRYLKTASLLWYFVGCVLGLATGNFRTSLLPVTLGLALVAPAILLYLHPPRLVAWRSRLRNVAAAMAILIVAHVSYTQAYGLATNGPPGYLALTGMMRIGLVAPLIQPKHFEGTGVSGDILKRVKLPLADHWQRGHQIWDERGLWRQLELASNDPEQVARTITRRAMLDHPLKLLQINIETLGGYFDAERVRWRLEDDKGVVAPDEHAIGIIKEWLHYDVSGVSARETPARVYFAHSTMWLTACLLLLAPLALITLGVGWRRPERAQYLLLALASLGLVASHLLFSHIVSFRYLHPLPWFVLANVAAVVGCCLRSASAPEVRESAGTPAP